MNQTPLPAQGPVDVNVRGQVRVSISIDADDAAFLEAVIRDTGNGGPLWGPAPTDEPDIVGEKHRAAWKRLHSMLERACDLHGMTSNDQAKGPARSDGPLA